MKYYTLLFILFTSMNISALYSQSEGSEEIEEEGAEIEILESEWDSEDEWGEFFGELEQQNMSKSSVTTIDLFFGMSQASLHEDKFSGSFAPAFIGELRLGDQTREFLTEDPLVVELEQYFLSFSNTAYDFIGEMDVKDDEVKLSSLRLGFGTVDGMGYKINNEFEIIPYYGDYIFWNWFDYDNKPQIAEDMARLNSFGKQVRFGDSWAAGVKINIIEGLALDASYQKDMVFQRHMFWYWTLSEIIEGVGVALVDEFNDEVMENSRWAGPIVSFLLKNAVSWGMFELREKNMNWPINTVPPVVYESFKAGISFGF